MVEAVDKDNWISVSCFRSTDGGIEHLIVRLSNPCDPSHPTVEFSSNGKHWALVILSWILNGVTNIRAPEEGTHGIISIALDPGSHA